VPDHLRMIRIAFASLGVETFVDNETLLVPARQRPAISADVDGAIPKIDDAPWPGFPADLTSLALVLATQCAGTVLIHEKLFESRLFFVDSLIAMGARVVLCDPHRALTIGPSRLHGATIVSPDIRAGMALIAAALCATGRSTIYNVRQAARGYEPIDSRLPAPGARPTRERGGAWAGRRDRASVRGEARRRRAPGTAPLHEPADADQSAPELHAAGGGRESPPAKG